MQLFFILLLALLPSQAFATGIYTQGVNKVEVTMNFYNDTETQHTYIEKCAEFQSGAPEKYNKACITERYTDQGTWDNCEIRFDDTTSCDKCERCEVNGETGIKIDCFNHIPAKGTNFVCIPFNNATVQDILVDDKFGGQKFVFNETAGVASDGGSNNGVENGDGGGSSGSSAVSSCAAIMAATVVLASIVSLI